MEYIDIDKTKIDRIKSAIETLLFIYGQPLSFREIAKATCEDLGEVKLAATSLIDDYEKRASGIRIRKIANAIQMVSAPENDGYVKALVAPTRHSRLSRSALEVLAIITYRQPVTRIEIDSIRGVRSEKVIEGLMNKGLIDEAGRSEAIGRPILYRTTRDFLAYMNLSSLRDLPSFDDFSNIEVLLENKSEPSSSQMSFDDINL